MVTVCSAKYSSAWDAGREKHAYKKDVELPDVAAFSHAQRQLREVNGQPSHVGFPPPLLYFLLQNVLWKEQKKSTVSEAVLVV